MRPWSLEWDVLGIPVGLVPPLLLAALLGAIVGLEREVSGHPAGLRTHILVAVGSALAAIVSVSMAAAWQPADPGRIAAQVVTGVGFLGAGAIIREGAGVRGLTTAASIWTTAMVGMAAGTSARLGLLALVASLLVLLVLWGLHGVEKWMLRRGLRSTTLEVHVSADARAISDVVSAVAAAGASVDGMAVEQMRSRDMRRVTVRVRLAGGTGAAALASQVAELDGVRHVSWEE